MPDSAPLVLTFAEIEFLLHSAPDPSTVIRERLRLASEPSDVLAAAGIASLLARGLCELVEDEVRPATEILAVIAGLNGDNVALEAVGWINDLPVVLHLFTNSAVRLAVFPAAYGQFTVELLDAGEPVTVPVVRFVDACTGSGADQAVAVRADTGRGRVSAVVAVDATGQWYVSDTEHSPDRGEPTTREHAVQRIQELLGPHPVGARR